MTLKQESNDAVRSVGNRPRDKKLQTSQLITCLGLLDLTPLWPNKCRKEIGMTGWSMNSRTGQ